MRRTTALFFRAALALCALGASAQAWPQPIVLGQIGPFTGRVAPDATSANQGIKAWIAQANKAGGIRGQPLTLFELDDHNTPDGFAEQFAKALERKPIALIMPIGSAAIKRLLDDKLLDSAPLVVMNAVPGAESLRNPGHAKLFHVRAGDKQQIEEIITNARTMGLTRLTVWHQDLPVGSSGLAVAQQVARALKGIEIQAIESGADAAALDAAAKQVAAGNGQGVLIIGAPHYFTAEAIAALRKTGSRQSIFALSYVSVEQIIKLVGLEGARGIGIARVFPLPNGRTLPLQRDFQAAMKEAFPQLQQYNSQQLEGYLSARIVGEALKHAKNTAMTAASLAATLPAMGEIDFGGFRLDFSKSNVGSHYVNIGVISGDGKLYY